MNQDGDFEDSGEQMIEFPRFTANVNGSISIPTTVISGTTRLRVGMKYVGFSGTPPSPCESFSGGEVEDYCVRIDNRIPTNEILRGNDFEIFPNPFPHYLTVKNKNASNKTQNIELYTIDGRILYSKTIENNPIEMVLTDLPPLCTGLYFLKIRTDKGIWITKVVH